MRTPRPRIASFEDLMANRHGRPEPRLLRPQDDVQALIADYHGRLPAMPCPKPARTARLATAVDDGLLLAQRRLEPPRPALPLPTTASPVPNAHDVAPAPAAPPPRDTAVAEPSPPPAPAEGVRAESFVTERPGPALARGQPPLAEDDLLAEIESIVKGHSVYDPVRQMTVPKSALKEYPREPREGEPPEPAREGAAAAGHDSQAIFDRIAMSMQHAGAYDLGTVELENRFSSFDRTEQDRDQAAAEKARQRAAPRPRTPIAPMAAPVDAKDFIEDLDAIQRRPASAAPALLAALSVPGRYSAALYDTGEHVLAGEHLYRDQLRVGQAPGVAFSYGQIIAMADLFGTVDDMMAADVPQLAALKRLIEQSTAHYRGGGPTTANVETGAWGGATGGRYMRLAADNYDHFAPNFLFPGAQFAAAAARHGDHQAAWQHHHERAIGEAQRDALDAASARTSRLPMVPLIVNAFGDHFLTDAFAAGHVVNKAAVMEAFKTAFFSGSALRPEARAFFDRVAAKAWHGRLAQEFRKLETAEPYDGWWNIVRWNPDIKNAERFASVLKGAAEQAPDEVANIAVKVMHDMLNRDGVDVVNDAGAPPWRLTGDGHLTPRTLAVMKQAVAQSAANITDPSILASDIAIGNYFAKVWAHVPRLTAAAQQQVRELVTATLHPASSAFVDAAAGIVHDECDALIALLIEKKALQKI